MTDSTGSPARSAVQVRNLRRSLLAQRDEAEAMRSALERDVAAIVDAATVGATDDEHDPEGATIAFERAQAGALQEQAVRRLGDLDEALASLARGEYGRCERCSQPIAPERLEALPAARRCIACARLSSTST